MVAVTFEVVSLCTNAQSASVFTLPQNISGTPLLECSAGWSSNVAECRQCLKICGPSKRSSVSGIAKSRTGPNLAGGRSNFIIDFLAKNSRTANAS
jgi:hypothetical protein